MSTTRGVSLIKFIYFDFCLAFLSIPFFRAVDYILHGEFFVLYVFPGIGGHSLICRSFSGITGWRWKISAFVHSRPPCRNHQETAGFGPITFTDNRSSLDAGGLQLFKHCYKGLIKGDGAGVAHLLPLRLPASS